MKSEYIQLPPLPKDMPLESIELVWLYARLPEEEQEMLRNFIRESLNGRSEKNDEVDFSKLISDSAVEVDPNILEYVNLMRKMVGTLIAQSCELSAIIYQRYCIKKSSVKEISDELNLDEEFVQLMTQYYDNPK
ncbi:hypothetical protein D7V86_16545 [bacterium D16-51]|nr:hypothetical protein D7V96_18615 [bacterium D16-59]RKI57968.1 hypothetical protein D7V86_16545 [bacterium D16-51]